MCQNLNKPTIQIKCQGADALPIDSILEFQGGLKKLSKKNLDKLKANILRNGFIAPIFVWDDAGQYRILDGHGRLKALCSLRQDGYDIPLLPVDYIQADSEEDARKKLLSITGQYGNFDDSELREWLSQIEEKDREILRLVDKEKNIDDILAGNEKKNFITVKGMSAEEADALYEELENRGFSCRKTIRSVKAK